jgi:adenosine kinase
MIQHAHEFAAAGIPFVFDPGQGLPMFDGADLKAFVRIAQTIAVNDYEAQLLCERTGLSLEAIAGSDKTLLVTRGAAGSHIYRRGCGDAYRAGLLYGIAQGMDWESTGRLASTMGALKIEEKGPQNHAPSRDEIAERFHEAFGYRPWS